MVIIAGVVWFARPETGSVSAAVRPAPDPVFAGRDTRRDMYGNQIDPAVADYSIDLYGEMYERHAPDTALPELGQPES